MQKLFCDKCNTEITDENASVSSGPDLRLISAAGPADYVLPFGLPGNVMPYKVNIRVVLEGLPPKTDICRHCVIDAVTKLDDRPVVSSRQ